MEFNCSKWEEIPLCKGEDEETYYQPLKHCISGTTSKRWNDIRNRSASLSPAELRIHGKYFLVLNCFAVLDQSKFSTFSLFIHLCLTGVHPEDFSEDLEYQKSVLLNYWSLLTPLIFSDHPKRLAEEEPAPPYNMIRNVMDMNAHYGGLNAALLESGKSVWVMNVVPVGARDTLPLILDRGLAGVFHDW